MLFHFIQNLQNPCPVVTQPRIIAVRQGPFPKCSRDGSACKVTNVLQTHLVDLFSDAVQQVQQAKGWWRNPIYNLLRDKTYLQMRQMRASRQVREGQIKRKKCPGWWPKRRTPRWWSSSWWRKRRGELLDQPYRSKGRHHFHSPYLMYMDSLCIASIICTKPTPSPHRSITSQWESA